METVNVEKLEGGSEHYKHAKVEPLHLIEAWNLPFGPANVIKYVTRAHTPSASWLWKKQCLEKAKWYLDRALKQHLELENQDQDMPEEDPVPYTVGKNYLFNVDQALPDGPEYWMKIHPYEKEGDKVHWFRRIL